VPKVDAKFILVRGVGSVPVVVVGVGLFSRTVPLVEMDGLFTSAFVQPDHRALRGAVFADVGTFGRAFGSAGVVLVINGEFDPGSGRTLAACLTHASRTVNPFGGDQWRTGE
jgi:ABC-type tungstate transport system substrate-binding protein